jgi:hypothetical protein
MKWAASFTPRPLHLRVRNLRIIRIGDRDGDRERERKAEKESLSFRQRNDILLLDVHSVGQSLNWLSCLVSESLPSLDSQSQVPTSGPEATVSGIEEKRTVSIRSSFYSTRNSRQHNSGYYLGRIYHVITTDPWRQNRQIVPKRRHPT